MNGSLENRTSESPSDKLREWYGRQVNWDSDSKRIRELFDSTWTGHRITNPDYFKWHLLDNCYGQAIAFCAEPADGRPMVAGVYLVIPGKLLVAGEAIDFNISLYTMTHPEFYRKGVFKTLANMTYDRCRKIGIRGTVGVPNNNSLHGFSKGLQFDVIGQFGMFARFVSPSAVLPQGAGSPVIREIRSDQDLDGVDLSFVREKSIGGVHLFNRSAKFIAWRFLKCPTLSYRVFIAEVEDDKAVGLLALRKAYRKGIPITILMDFLVDCNTSDPERVARLMMKKVHRIAIANGTPLLFTLMNHHSQECRLLKKNGFRNLPPRLLPHNCNFILRFHGLEDKTAISRLKCFENWYFSFSDLDLY